MCSSHCDSPLSIIHRSSEFFPCGLSRSVGPLPINHRGDSFFTVSPFLERGKGFITLSLAGFCTGFPVYFTLPCQSVQLSACRLAAGACSLFKVQYSVHDSGFAFPVFIPLFLLPRLHPASGFFGLCRNPFDGHRIAYVKRNCKRIFTFSVCLYD